MLYDKVEESFLRSQRLGVFMCVLHCLECNNIEEYHVLQFLRLRLFAWRLRHLTPQSQLEMY